MKPVAKTITVLSASLLLICSARQGHAQGMPAEARANIHALFGQHTNISRSVTMTKDGYVAVTAADGSFTIPDLPAGEEVELQVWHERSTGPNGALAADMPELDWSSKGRFTVTLEADGTTDIGEVQIPASAVGS